MRWGFREADIARDGSLKGEILEVFFDFFEDLKREAGAFVVHRGDDAEKPETWVGLLHDELHRL